LIGVMLEPIKRELFRFQSRTITSQLNEPDDIVFPNMLAVIEVHQPIA
jgi:hypothetical protein